MISKTVIIFSLVSGAVFFAIIYYAIKEGRRMQRKKGKK